MVRPIHEVAMYSKMNISCNTPISEKLPFGPGHNGITNFTIHLWPGVRE